MSYYSAFVCTLTALTFAVTDSKVSPRCARETKVLQEDSFLSMVQEDLYSSYHDDFDKLCDFSKITEPDCGLEFDGDNKTYVAACQDKGGQVLTRPVVFKCGYSVATINIDLGYVPTCIGASCDASMIEPHELNDTRVEQFLLDIGTGIAVCDADFSAGVSKEIGVLPAWMISIFLVIGGFALL